MGTRTFEFQSRYARRLRAEGRAEGEARLLLRVLDGRGIEVPDDIRRRIIECADIDQIEAWTVAARWPGRTVRALRTRPGGSGGLSLPCAW